MLSKSVSLLGALGTLVLPLFAAPRLEVRLPPAERDAKLNRPVWVAPGGAGPNDLFFFVFNAGDGTLDLQLSADAPWLSASAEPLAACAIDAQRMCRRARVQIQAGGLEPGTFQGSVLIAAPGAVDAPQSLPVTIHVGGAIPERIDLFVPPDNGAGDSIDFQTPAGDAPSVGAAGSFLSVSSNNLGSFRFLHEHRLVGVFRPGTPEGDNQGALTVAGSSFDPDNRTVPVTMRVTREPISRLTSRQVRFAGVGGRGPAVTFLGASNRGRGELTINELAASTESGGDWLSAELVQPGLIQLSADLEGLQPGLHRATLRIDSNAANSPQQVPVWLTLAAEGPPEAAFRGAVNGANFENTRPLAPGSIVSLFGSQLSFPDGGLLLIGELPLPRQAAGTRVLIGGVQAPLFFLSPNQLNVQVPVDVPRGNQLLQVVRDGQTGNEIRVNIAERSIGLFKLSNPALECPSISPENELPPPCFGAIQNASRNNTLPLPSRLSAAGFNAQPAKPGDALVVFATGLGPTSPMVPSGQAAASDPLAVVTAPNAEVFFDFRGVNRVRPIFVGLSPGFVGLYQINVVVPALGSANERSHLSVTFGDGSQVSNAVWFAFEP